MLPCEDHRSACTCLKTCNTLPLLSKRMGNIWVSIPMLHFCVSRAISNNIIAVQYSFDNNLDHSICSEFFSPTYDLLLFPLLVFQLLQIIYAHSYSLTNKWISSKELQGGGMFCTVVSKHILGSKLSSFYLFMFNLNHSMTLLHCQSKIIMFKLARSPQLAQSICSEHISPSGSHFYFHFS
jgi:hypothetical protein